jgi:hypothetical protein
MSRMPAHVEKHVLASRDERRLRKVSVLKVLRAALHLACVLHQVE